MSTNLSPPPLGDPNLSFVLKDWLNKLYRDALGGVSGLLPWTNVSKSGSNLTEIETRLHTDLQNLNSSTHYHLTQTEYTDLTDAGATVLHKHDHGGQDGLSDDDHTQYVLANGTRNIIGPQVITVNSASTALRVTQEGSGNILELEDASNPDASPLAVGASGEIGIGTQPNTSQSIRIDRNITANGGTNTAGINILGTIQSDVTLQHIGFQSTPAVVDASFTLGTIAHFSAVQGTFGASSTVTNQYGFLLNNNLAGAVNNYGIMMNMNAATDATIAKVARTSNVVTITTAANHNFKTGQSVDVQATTNTEVNGILLPPATITVTGATTFTYSKTGGDITEVIDTGTVFNLAKQNIRAAGTAPSWFTGRVIIDNNSAAAALRVTQRGTGYALVVEDTTNPDSTPFSIDNAGNLVASANTTLGSSTSNTTKITGNAVLPNNAGFGLQVNPTTPSFGWRDIIGWVHPKATGAGTPARATYAGANIGQFKFVAGDICDFEFHLPHDYVPSTDIYVHVHWSHNGTAITGNAVFDLYHTYAKGHNQANFPAEKNVTITYATTDIATTPQYRHRIDEVIISGANATATLMDRDDLEPDGMILLGLKLTTLPTITAGDLFVHHVDIHYQSTGMATLNKAPNFYA